MADAPGLRALLDGIAQEQHYDKHEVSVTPVCTGGGNYTSEVFLITIKAPGKEDLRLFAKEANINGKMRDEAPITKFYETERFVYGTLVGVYGRLEEKNRVPAEHRLRFPKYFGCNPKLFEETIVLEDLSARGFGTHDRLRSIDWPYAVAAVTELAKFHALSFAYEQDDPQEYARVLRERTSNVGTDEQKMKAVWEGMVRSAVAACREEHRARLAKYLAGNVASKWREYSGPLRRPVLTHGDFRPSNLMHKIKQDGSLEVVTVDYQMVHTGCAATDLLYLVFSGTDGQFRARHYSALVDEYYRQLQAALRRLNIHPDQVYPREDFDYELNECLPYGLIVAVFVLPLVTVEAANAPRLDQLTVESWHVTPSSLFAERISGIVDDYVAWAVL